MIQNLLIVDDEENIINSLRRLFRREAFGVLTATSAAAGLEILEKETVSVVLSDQRMPGMIGSDFLKIVKEKYPDTIRMVMSGYTELESITSAINDGAIYKFLLKPWDDEKLTKHIRDAFFHYELKFNNEKLTDQIKILNEKLLIKLKDEESKNLFNGRTLALSQKLLDVIPIAVFAVSTDGLVVMANAQAKIFIRRAGVIGCQANEIFPESVMAAINEYRNDCLETHWPLTNQVVKINAVTSDGNSFFCISIL